MINLSVGTGSGVIALVKIKLSIPRNFSVGERLHF